MVAVVTHILTEQHWPTPPPPTLPHTSAEKIPTWQQKAFLLLGEPQNSNWQQKLKVSMIKLKVPQILFHSMFPNFPEEMRLFKVQQEKLKPTRRSQSALQAEGPELLRDAHKNTPKPKPLDLLHSAGAHLWSAPLTRCRFWTLGSVRSELNNSKWCTGFWHAGPNPPEGSSSAIPVGACAQTVYSCRLAAECCLHEPSEVPLIPKFKRFFPPFFEL